MISVAYCHWIACSKCKFTVQFNQNTANYLLLNNRRRVLNEQYPCHCTGSQAWKKLQICIVQSGWWWGNGGGCTTWSNESSWHRLLSLAADMRYIKPARNRGQTTISLHVSPYMHGLPHEYVAASCVSTSRQHTKQHRSFPCPSNRCSVDVLVIEVVPSHLLFLLTPFQRYIR